MQNNIVTVLGRKGTGKTEFTKKLIAKSEKKRIFIADFLSEYFDGLVFTKINDVIDFIVDGKRLDDFKVILREYNEEEFNVLCKIVWELGDCLLVCEEIDMFFSPSYISDELALTIRCGRHKEIDQIYISRRPYEVNRLITSQSDIIYISKYFEPRDVEYIKKIAPSYEPEKMGEFEFYKYEAN